MYQLTIEESFDSAHFLAGYQGKCGNIHGHRWRVCLTIEMENLQEGTQERGMCMDFSTLKGRLREVLAQYDHIFLLERGSLKETTMQALREEGFSMMELSFRPTAENFARHFFEQFKELGYPVAKVQVYETPNNCATYVP